MNFHSLALLGHHPTLFRHQSLHLRHLKLKNIIKLRSKEVQLENAHHQFLHQSHYPLLHQHRRHHPRIRHVHYRIENLYLLCRIRIQFLQMLVSFQ